MRKCFTSKSANCILLWYIVCRLPIVVHYGIKRVRRMFCFFFLDAMNIYKMADTRNSTVYWIEHSFGHRLALMQVVSHLREPPTWLWLVDYGHLVAEILGGRGISSSTNRCDVLARLAFHTAERPQKQNACNFNWERGASEITAPVHAEHQLDF